MARIKKIFGFAVIAALTMGAVGTSAASGATQGTTPGTTVYEFCVAPPPFKVPRRLRSHIRVGCHKHFVVDSVTDTWEVEGEPGWSGSYETYRTPGLSDELLTFFWANSPQLCDLLAGEKVGNEYGGEIDLNVGKIPGRECAQQTVTWYTEELVTKRR